MSEIIENNLKKTKLKLAKQTTQLKVVKALVSRANGYQKVQAQASETRLEKEITALDEQVQQLEKELKKSPKKAPSKSSAK